MDKSTKKNEVVIDARVNELLKRIILMERKMQLMEKLLAANQKAVREHRVNITHLKRKDKPLNG